MSQRLTDSDASFLYMETASGPMHISSIYVLEGELAFPEVYQHLAERIHLIPSYRRKLAQVPFNLAHATWVDDPEFDLGNHVLHHQLPEGSSLQAGIDAAVELNEAILDRRRPLWRFRVINGVPGKTLILQQTHHAMIDGVSGIELTTILYDFDPKGGNRPPPEASWEPEPVPGPLERFADALKHNFDKARNSDPMALLRDGEQQRHLLARAARVMTQFVSRPAITAPFNAGLVGPKRQVQYLKKSFAEIREIRRALGGTINDVVLAVLSEAVARYLEAHGETTESQYLRVMCPVSVRTEDQAGALGNQVSAIFPTLPAWSMSALQRLNAVCTETDRIKHDQEAQALALMTQGDSLLWPLAMAPSQLVGTPWDPTALAARLPLPVPATGGWRPPNLGFNFTCTNVPGVQVPQYLCGHKVTDTIGLLVLTGNVGFSVTILSYNKELFFNFICEPRLLPDLETIVAAAADVFGELCEAARERAELLAS
ncbi:MAG: wax ester/triacylglycerol synthase family O-acyltransferase [Pseudomonadales bacterium]